MTNFESLKILIFHRVQGGKIVENDAAGKKKISMLIITRAGACNSSFAEEENRAHRTSGGLDGLRGNVTLGEVIISWET